MYTCFSKNNPPPLRRCFFVSKMGKICYNRIFARVAQGIEQEPSKLKVAGSIPAPGTIRISHCNPKAGIESERSSECEMRRASNGTPRVRRDERVGERSIPAPGTIWKFTVYICRGALNHFRICSIFWAGSILSLGTKIFVHLHVSRIDESIYQSLICFLYPIAYIQSMRGSTKWIHMKTLT